MCSAADRCVCPLHRVFLATQPSSVFFHMHISANVVPTSWQLTVRFPRCSKIYRSPFCSFEFFSAGPTLQSPPCPEVSRLQDKWQWCLTTQAKDLGVILDSPLCSPGLSPGGSSGHSYLDTIQSFPPCHHQLSPGLRSPVLPSPPCGNAAASTVLTSRSDMAPQFFTSFLAQNSEAPACPSGLRFDHLGTQCTPASQEGSAGCKHLREVAS